VAKTPVLGEVTRRETRADAGVDPDADPGKHPHSLIFFLMSARE